LLIEILKFCEYFGCYRRLTDWQTTPSECLMYQTSHRSADDINFMSS